jgi:hypothetical protein
MLALFRLRRVLKSWITKEGTGQCSQEKHGIWYSSTGFPRELELNRVTRSFLFFSLHQRAADVAHRKFIIPLVAL